MRLTVKTLEGTHLLCLEWHDGLAVIVSVTERIRPAAERWLSHGINEWVGTGADAEPRHTDSSSMYFLPRLKSYLDAQFDFTVTVTDS